MPWAVIAQGIIASCLKVLHFKILIISLTIHSYKLKKSHLGAAVSITINIL